AWRPSAKPASRGRADAPPRDRSGGAGLPESGRFPDHRPGPRRVPRRTRPRGGLVPAGGPPPGRGPGGGAGGARPPLSPPPGSGDAGGALGDPDRRPPPRRPERFVRRAGGPGLPRASAGDLARPPPRRVRRRRPRAPAHLEDRGRREPPPSRRGGAPPGPGPGALGGPRSLRP